MRNRHRVPMIRFLFDSHGMFFVMAIFLNQEKTHAHVEFEEALDFVQIGIFFFFIYFGMYYLPALNLGDPKRVGSRDDGRDCGWIQA